MAIFETCSISTSNLIGSFFSCITGFLDLGSGSIFGIGIMLVIGMVSFLASKSYSYDRAMGVSGFVTLVAGFIILKLGWISNKVFILAAIWFVIGLYYLIKDRGGEEL